MNTIINFFRKLFGIQDEPTTPPTPPNPCDTPPCKTARDNLAAARARFTSICNSIRGLTQVLRILRAILSTPWWVFVALGLLALVIGGLAALGFAALILAWGVSWFLTVVIARILQSLGQSLAQAGTEIAAAIPQVVANCPDNCRGDLSIPSCTP